MADRIKGITIEIGGDTTGLNKALSEVNKEISSTQSQLKDVSRLLKLDPSNTELLSQKQKLLSQAVSDTKEKLETLKTAEAQAQEQFKEGKISEEQYDALKREVIATEQQLKTLEKQAGEANVTLQQISLAGEKFQEVGQKIEGAGKKLLPVTAAVAGIGAAAVKTTADFDESMSNVSAISGATGDDFDKLRAKAREMGAETKFSASDAADAMTYMAMAGWKTDDMLSGISGIMDLAAASGADLATTSDIVTDALTGMGYTAADAGRLADVMAAASSNANTNVEMMGETFKYVAPVCGSLGYSMEDTALAVGLMANSGIKASQSGTQLRAAITNMVKPTEAMEGVMQELGIEVANEDGTMKSLDETMQILRSSFAVTTEEQKKQKLEMIEQEAIADGYGDTLSGLTDEEKYFKLAMYAGQKQVKSMSEAQFKKQAQDKLGIKVTKKTNRAQVEQNLALSLGTQAIEGLTQEQQSSYAATLFGKEAMSGMLAIINASEEDYKKLSDAINNSSGSAKEMSEVMQDNLNGQLTILKSQLEEAAISIGDSLVPMIRALVGKIQEWVDWYNSLEDSQKRTIATVGLIVAAIGPLLIMIGQIATGIGALMTAVTSLGAVFAALSAVGGPLLLTAAAIGAIALVLAESKEKTSEYYDVAADLTDQEAENKTKVDELYAAYDQLNQRRADAAASVETEANKERDLFAELQGITDENGNVLEGYEERAQYILGELSTALGQEYTMTGNQIDNYKDMCNSIDQLIVKKQANALLSANEAAYTEALQKQTDAFMAYNEAQKDVEETKKALDEAQKKEKQYQEELNTLYEKNRETNGAYARSILEASDKVKEAGDQAAGYSDKLQGLNQTLADAESAYVGYNATIANYEGLSAASISGDQQKISDAVLKTMYNFQTAETSTRESLERQVNDFSQKYTEMKATVDAGAPGITQSQVDNMKTLVDLSKQELDKLPDMTGESISNTAKTLTDKSAEFEEAGKTTGQDYAAGLAGGIEEGTAKVETAAGNVADAGIDATKEALDSHSPSRETHGIGLDFDEGFAGGIEEGTNNVTAAVNKVATTATGTLSGNLASSQTAIQLYQTTMSNNWQTWAAGLVTQLKTTLSEISTETDTKMTALDNKVTEVMESVSQIWKKRWTEIRDDHEAAMDKVKTNHSDKLTEMEETNHTKTDGIKSDSVKAFADMVDGIKSEVDTLPGIITAGFDPAVDYIEGLTQKSRGWGVDMMDNYIAGIRSKIRDLEEACEAAADTVSDYLHHSTPEKGPMKNDDEWMPDMMQGFARGIRDNKRLVTDQMKDLTWKMAEPMNGKSARQPIVVKSYNQTILDGKIVAESINERLGEAL